MIALDATDLAIGASLVVATAGVSLALGLGLTRSLLIAACRTTLQLLLVGYVLKLLFASSHPAWIGAAAVVMLAVAGYEVSARQERRLAGMRSIGIGTLSMFVASFSVTMLALTVILGPDPWYSPRYALPLLGMVLGNTMNGVALGMDRLTEAARAGRDIIEQRLMLGQDCTEAMSDIRRRSMRSGLIPLINAMSAAGIVSLPGMMTGQILAGVAPVEAVKYQVLIMFLIAAGTALGTICAVWLSARALFDARQRLRLDRLVEPA